MRTRRARRHGVLALAAALLLVSQSASANHGTSTTTLSDYHTNAYPTVTGQTEYGADEPATTETQLPTGWLVAHQVSNPATPISPVPNDEEVVGTGTSWALWVHTFCRQDDVNFTVTWEATIDANAPANTVAQLTATAINIFTTQIYVVRNAANDYDVEIPNMPTASVCSSTTDGLTTLLLDGITAGGRKVAQNPSTAGNYTGTGIYTDTNGTTHTTTGNTITIVS